MYSTTPDICLIVAVRHGQTSYNQTGILQGHLDIALDDTGLMQAEKLAKRLKNCHFDYAFSSDLARARVTAETILQYHPNLPLVCTEKLREWNLGGWQGRTIADIQKEEPHVYDAFRLETSDLTIPNGEKAQDFQERVSTFMDDLAQKCYGKIVLAVSHGGAIQRMLRHATGAIDSPNIKPFCSNASIAVFKCRKPLIWQLMTWNDAAHLESTAQSELLPL